MFTQNITRFQQAYRRIHMDYHNPAFLSEVGKNFNPKEYVRTLKEANINGLVVFSKCHHGNSYYKTQIGQIHPALKVDMMGDIINECVKREITPIVYYSVGWDRKIAKQNKDWLQRTKEGKLILSRVFEFICLNSPYKEEVVFPQLKEIIRNYSGFIGFWLDIVWMAPTGCYCNYCRRKFESQYGHSIENAADYERKDFLGESTLDFLEEARQVIKGENSSILMSFNQIHLFSSLTSTPSSEKHDKLWRIVDFVSVESHIPNYGSIPRTMGILDASFKAKYCRGFKIPFEITPSRFIHSWGAWDILPLAHLKTVFAQIVTNGGVINCGDQTYPDGTLDKGVYNVLGKAFEFIMKRENHFKDKKEIPNVCLLVNKWGSEFRGAAQILTQIQVPFAIRDSNQVKQENLCKYSIVICPALEQLDQDLVRIFKEYLNEGGKILADYSTPTIEKGILEEIFGVKYLEKSPYSIGYLDLSSISKEDGLFKMPLIVNGSFAKVKLGEANEVFSWINPRTETTEERYLRHSNAPPGIRSRYPGVTINSVSKGKSIFIAAPVFKDFWESYHWYLRSVIRILLQKLEPEPLFKIEGDYVDLEITLTKSKNSIQVHFITYAGAPRTKNFSLIEKNPVVCNLKVSISQKLISNPKKVYLAPEKQELNLQSEDGYLKVTIPRIQAYNVLVLEGKDNDTAK